MLRKSNRLTRDEFNHLLNKNTTLRDGRLLFRYRKLDDVESLSKFSVVISKKVAKGAITRHLLKRRVYAVLRDHRRDLKPGFYAGFFIQKGFADLNYSENETIVLSLLKQSNII
ncbi:MAG: ribonuclease P protein component [Candidatus Nomurabacteria bacterium]|nr:ribonuclease P protein component [Candidatus Nomurabacteria bacterium]